MNNIGLLIDFDNNKIIKAFEKIEVESTYTTIDESGVINYILVKSVEGDNIEFDLLSPYTEDWDVICIACDEKFTPMYDERLKMFGVEPIATCPHCYARYSETLLLDVCELKEVEEEGDE